MSDDDIEEMVRDLIGRHLDDDGRKLAVEWLDRVADCYAAMKKLKLID